MADHDVVGRPATELTGSELEQQGTQAHEEYLRRHPRRTWQGSGGAAAEGGLGRAIFFGTEEIRDRMNAFLTRPAPGPVGKAWGL